MKKLQQKLNSAGYNLSVDGKFGSKTQAAVKDYQKKNGLSVDGIVGKNTWGKLTTLSKGTGNATDKDGNTVSVKNGTLSSSAQKNKIPTASVLKETARPQYKESTALAAAQTKLENWENSTPSEYKSKYSAEIEKMLDDILNREKFSYNLNADPLYEQYRELYTQNAKKAMLDTIGEVSALSGGYGSSYAVTAGNQAYDEYLDKLNNVALDLRDRAYDKYSDEGDKLLEDITLLRSLDDDDYEKYLGSLERYYSDGEYLLERLTSMSDEEYEKFVEETDAWENDRKYNFDKYTDTLDREEFERELAFKNAEAKRDQSNKNRNYALDLKKTQIAASKAVSSSKSSSSKVSSGTSSSGKKSSGKNTLPEAIKYPETYKEFYRQTGYSGIMTEKEYAAHSVVKKKYGTYSKYLKAMYKKYKK